MKWFRGLVIVLILFMIVGVVGAADRATSNPEAIGLSLFFQNGQIAPLTLVGDAPRYLQEIDLVATVATTTDRGIEPIIENSDLAALDWSGIIMVEEDWRAAGDGTFIRQRFYRHAKWMEAPSLFRVVPSDESRTVVGQTLIAHTGTDDTLNAGDDGFVRRFVARQIAFGCLAEDDCTGATFVAQGLVQLSHALHAEQRARPIPSKATRLELKWSQQPHTSRTIHISHASPTVFPYGYGFQPALETVSAPANGHYYVPGETVKFQVSFRDGRGNRLHAAGVLPSYDQFLRGEVASGLRYYNGFALFPTTY